MCPGVCRVRKRSEPMRNSSPSLRNRTRAPSWIGPSATHDGGAPIPLSIASTGRVAAKARMPLTKSAWWCVSATATIRRSSARASAS